MHARFDSLCDQIRDAVDLYGDRLGVRICRKHISASIAEAPIKIAAPMRRRMQSRLCQIERSSDLIAELEHLYLADQQLSVA